MFRIIIISFFCLMLGACASTPTPTESFRIGKITVQSNGQEFGAHIADELRWKIRYFAQNAGSSLPENAPVRDIEVSLADVKFARPSGIIVLGRSSLEVHAFLGPQTAKKIRVKDSSAAQSFNPQKFYGFEATFNRLTDRMAANIVSVFYRGALTGLPHAHVKTPTRNRNFRPANQRNSSGGVSAPPQVLIGG